MEEDQQIEEGQKGHMLIVFVCYKRDRISSVFGLLTAIDPIIEEK